MILKESIKCHQNEIIDYFLIILLMKNIMTTLITMFIHMVFNIEIFYIFQKNKTINLCFITHFNTIIDVNQKDSLNETAFYKSVDAENNSNKNIISITN